MTSAEEWKTLRVKKSTYLAILKTKAYMELMNGETYSFNDAIEELLKYAPKIEAVEVEINP